VADLGDSSVLKYRRIIILPLYWRC